MGDLIIKPASSGNLKIQDQGGTERISLNTSGVTTFASNTTFSGTGNNIGTATAGTLGSSVVFPAGHVIQTTQTTYNSGDSDYISGATFTRFEASSSYHWTGAINNVLASSHVYITMCFSCVITTSSGDDIGAGFQIWRDTTAVLGGNKDGNFFKYAGSNNEKNLFQQLSLSFIDTSPDTGTNNYYLAGARQSGQVKINSDSNDQPFTCILQEIAQ